MPTVVIRAKQGHTIAVTGPVNLTSIHDQPSAAVITFGDGTVLDVDLAGRVIVIGLPLRHICVNHGGNHQECPI